MRRLKIIEGERALTLREQELKRKIENLKYEPLGPGPEFKTEEEQKPIAGVRENHNAIHLIEDSVGHMEHL